ncbi:MAG: 50S ribosomal protein L18 [Candidatus Parcubacteria bacterium]|nr:50S ribosomal protein L18 [Candidatus Parcubacteria bacterium]
MSKEIRHRRVRAKVRGTKDKPRLSVFRSNKHIFLQLIDDNSKKTLISASDFQPKAGPPRAEKKLKKTKTEIAREVGKLLAESAKAKRIKNVVFDRGGYKYHGRVKAAAEGAREGGLKL